MREKSFDTAVKAETCILVGLISDGIKESQVNEYLDELAFLAETAGAITDKRFTQKMRHQNSVTFVGQGKLDEIAVYVKAKDIDIAIFDEELSPSQLRNIEKVLGCRILDRTNLILDIFAQRATSANAKVQVELAQCEYFLPRLTGLWTHLERQRGGIGLRGPGETEIETDRRVIRTKIANLKEQLKKIDQQKATQRKNRGVMMRIALVGYTNVGKSTIMNLISKSEVFAENKLFATLDTTVRKVVIENLPFLLSDTVGFIRKLPHGLVESFKSTLDEVREADLLLHIVDISHPNFEEQINVVQKTIEEIGAADKPMFLVFNKVDAFTYIQKDADDLTEMTQANFSLDDFKQMWIAKNQNCVFISAKEKLNIEAFKKLVYDTIKEMYVIRYPHEHFLYEIHEE
jgi:GTP-binding protein HflX